MALTYNKVFLAGRLTRDPELKQTNSGLTVCSVTVAVDRRVKTDGNKVTDFFNCTAWRQQAEFLSTHFRKGSAIFIEGNLQTRAYEKDGEKRHSTDIVIDDIRFVENKTDSNTPSASNAPVGKNLGSEDIEPNLTEIDPENDDSLPF